MYICTYIHVYIYIYIYVYICYLGLRVAWDGLGPIHLHAVRHDARIAASSTHVTRQVWPFLLPIEEVEHRWRRAPREALHGRVFSRSHGMRLESPPSVGESPPSVGIPSRAIYNWLYSTKSLTSKRCSLSASIAIVCIAWDITPHTCASAKYASRCFQKAIAFIASAQTRANIISQLI